MIYLLLEHICRSEYDVSTRRLRALITYWCHVCCLRFRRDDLIVDGRQMVSLISVHGRGSLSDVYGLLHFSLVPVGFTGQYFCVLQWHWVSCGPAMVSYSCWFIQVCVFFESLAECSLSFTYVCVTAVGVTRNVMLLSHSGEYMANGLTNAIRHQFAMIAKWSPDIRRCS